MTIAEQFLYPKMSPRYCPPSVEPVQEGSEEESASEVRGKEARVDYDNSHRRYQSSSPAKMGGEKQKLKPKKSHKHTLSNLSKQTMKDTKIKPKIASTKHTNASREDGSGSTRRRHKRSPSNRDGDTASDSSNDEETAEQDHHAILASARERLTSPSLLSTSTSLTTATNNSGGSSGSNSTIIQVSLSKRSMPPKKPESIPNVDYRMSPGMLSISICRTRASRHQ